eukprot:TRINITY_DN75372_c0_g1_i1.p2 TRINITY_DN75372_c0_g1~~TRINITY_DN75372_c0_g1_i1.p2  ORF type:complete len:117 (-),score=47.90 TRINITY_DN75372_c0_g1_i1:61-411(-)
MARVWSLIFIVFAMMVSVTRAEDAEDVEDAEEVEEEVGEEAAMASIIEELDTDKDGAVSLAEILQTSNYEDEDGEDKEKLLATIKDKFAEHDVNKNDKLEVGEWMSFAQSFRSDEM